MIAITIRLSYATAICHAAWNPKAKTTENRGRPIPDRYIGQQVAIHAAAAWSKEGAKDPRILDWWWGDEHPRRRDLDATDFGPYFRKILAVATIADCHLAEWPLNDRRTCCQPWGDRTYGNRGEPAWHITLADIIALPEPVGPVRGHLRVPWNLPEDVATQVAIQLAALT